jgi:magnesium-transporting ATPase (P-type)
VLDYIGMGSDAVLAVATFAGVYYSFRASRLFKRDIMERVYRITTAAFLIVAFFSVLDFISIISNNFLVEIHLVRIAATVAVVLFVIALAMLVKWASWPEGP